MFHSSVQKPTFDIFDIFAVFNILLLRQLVVFYWSLRNRKFSQLSRIHLSILADHNNAVVWMDLILSQISNSSARFFPNIGYSSKFTNYN